MGVNKNDRAPNFVAWMYQADNEFLPVDLRIGADLNVSSDITDEYELLYRPGLDGVFADQPDSAVAARAGLAWHQVSFVRGGAAGSTVYRRSPSELMS